MKGINARVRIAGKGCVLIPAACALLLMISSLASAQQQVSTTDWKPVEQALGKSGSMQPGDVYKVSFPRSDLKVTAAGVERSEEHTSELQSRRDLVCRLLLEKKKKKNINHILNKPNTNI